jgi:hypothetical protein
MLYQSRAQELARQLAAMQTARDELRQRLEAAGALRNTPSYAALSALLERLKDDLAHSQAWENEW